MSFEDMIEDSEEFLRRKSLPPKEDLSWDPHLRSRFQQPIQTEERWTIQKIEWKPETKRGLVQTTLPEESDARRALKDFAWDLCGLPDIESISIFRSSDDVFNVATIIADFNLEVERKIAKAEVELMRKNPNLRFDFRVTPRWDRKLSDLMAKESEILYSKR